MRRSALLLLALALSGAAPQAHGDAAWLDHAERLLRFSTPDATWRGRISGIADLEVYRGDQSETGFVITESPTLFAPRLFWFLDVQHNENLYAFAQARIDRGFDPSSAPLRGRLDEYALRWSIVPGGALNLQVGQFSSVIGNWVTRHNPTDNPFVGAPLPYEHMTGAYDERAPLSPADFVLGPDVEEYEHVPIIWGPGYTTGVALLGKGRKWEYGVEVKNTGPSARPELWSITRTGFSNPSYNARIGYRPDLRWRIGASFSDSVYLRPAAPRPPGTSRADYREQLYGQDISFTWHHWQWAAELFEVRFEAPSVGHAWSYAGYVEARYKFSPTWYVAGRVNREEFSRLSDSTLSATPWGVDVTRYDVAVGYRVNADILAKLQATHRDESGRASAEHTAYAAQFTVRF